MAAPLVVSTDGGLRVGVQQIAITSLDDTTAEGTARYALTQVSGERNLNLAVAGDIVLTSDLAIADGHFTFDQHNAPGGGVQFKGYALNVFGATDFIFAHHKFRAGNYSGQTVRSCLNIGRGAKRGWLHHCEAEWAPYDDNLVIWNETGYPSVEDILIEYGIFAEGLHDPTNTGKCVEIGRSSGAASVRNIVFRRCLFGPASRDRSPLIGPNNESTELPALGIVLDNCVTSDSARGFVQVRGLVDAVLRNNVIRYGQNSPWPNYGELDLEPQSAAKAAASRFYHSGNEAWNVPDGTAKRAAIIKPTQSGFYYDYLDTPDALLPDWYNTVSVMTCDEAYAHVMAYAGSHAGGSRDSLTAALIAAAQDNGAALVESVTDVDYPDLTA